MPRPPIRRRPRNRTRARASIARSSRARGKRRNNRDRRTLRPSSYVRDPLDFYIEDRGCIDSLLDAESDWGTPILDPACGSGNIVRACQERGYEAIGTDIVSRGFGWEERDFLHDDPVIQPGSIICNPPYSLTPEFILRALALGVPKFAMLVGDKFRYSQERWPLFRDHRPATVYVLCRRPSLPPGELYLAGEIEAKGGTKDYEWMVWDHSYHGHTIQRWLPPNIDKTCGRSGVRLPIPQLANLYMTDAERHADAIANYDEALRAMRNRNMQDRR